MRHGVVYSRRRQSARSPACFYDIAVFVEMITKIIRIEETFLNTFPELQQHTSTSGRSPD